MPIRFQVDSDFYDHPKSLGMSDAATALWVRAGSYSAAKLTDGFIAEHVLALLSPAPGEAADELRRRGLWHRVRGGYRFHEWGERNLTKQRVEADRESDRKRKRRERGTAPHPAGQTGNEQVEGRVVHPESNRSPNGIQPESAGIPDVSVSVSVSESVSGSGQARASPEPSPRCPQHIDDPEPPPCGACADARRVHDRWEAAEADRRRAAPRCRRHPTEYAHNCRNCLSERKARPPEEPA